MNLNTGRLFCLCLPFISVYVIWSYYRTYVENISSKYQSKMETRSLKLSVLILWLRSSFSLFWKELNIIFYLHVVLLDEMHWPTCTCCAVHLHCSCKNFHWANILSVAFLLCNLPDGGPVIKEKLNCKVLPEHDSGKNHFSGWIQQEKKEILSQTSQLTFKVVPISHVFFNLLNILH